MLPHLFNQSRRRGIALLTAVMIALVMSVVARGILHLQIGLTSQQNQLEKRARLAATSGLEYAKSQLAKDTKWKGSDTRGTTVDNGRLTIKEQDGVVIGLMRFEDGGQAQFRIRFNAQDGSGGVDDLGDPSDGYFVDNLYLSMNNLGRSSEADLPRVRSNFKADPSESDGKVPGRSVLIQVEGRAGQGIDGLSPAQPNATPSGHVTQASAQAVLKAKLPETTENAVLQTAGNIDFSGGQLEVSSADTASPAIRSKKKITAQHSDSTGDAPLSMPGGGNVYCQDGALGLTALYDSNQVTVREELPNNDLLQISWDQVEKAGPGYQINAGVYVLWPGIPSASMTDGAPELHYYDMSYQEYRSNIYEPYILQGTLPPDQGVVVNTYFTNTGGEGHGPTSDAPKVRVTNNQIFISGDLTIAKTSNTGDFALIPLCDAPLSSSEPRPPLSAAAADGKTVDIQGGDPLTINIMNSKVQAQGDLVLKGAVLNVNDTTLIGEQNLILNTKSLSVTGSGSDETNLSLYFKGDVTVSTLSTASGPLGTAGDTYGDFSIAGTVYSWGDILADVGSQGGGKFEFRGTMVAYGGNPDDPRDPNSNKGGFRLLADSAKLIYDPTTVTQVVSPEDLGNSIVFTAASLWVK